MLNHRQGSPHSLASSLLEQYRSGVLSAEEFNSRLQQLETQFDGWYSQLESVPVSEKDLESQQLLEDARESLAAVYEGLGMLRESIQSDDLELAEDGLETMKLASDFMADLIAESDDNLEKLRHDNPGGMLS